MSGKSDQAKGRTKEAAGVLTGNEDLEAAGRDDRRTGEAKESVDRMKDGVDDALDGLKDKVHDVTDSIKDALDRK